MNKKYDDLNALQLLTVNEAEPTQREDSLTERKPFVEPEVSFPVEVLEATTFFQLTDSGAL